MQQFIGLQHVFRRHVRVAMGALSLAGMALTGCGGGDGGSTAVPQGNAGVRAIAIAADQSIASGRAFPLAAIIDTAPTGSVFSKAAKASGRAAQTRTGGTLVFDSALGLYKTYTTSGNTQSVAYYSDSAGTSSAGTASMTIVGATTFSTDYKTYPVTINFTANVVGGTLPFSGSGTVIYNGPTGANSLTGKFTLPKNNVVVSGNMSLDASNNVGGSCDVQESGATLHITGISGNLTSDLTGNISCDPYGWKGTGTFNLQTGKFSITLNTGTGTATASSDASGSLTLHFADGTSQTITSPLTSTLAGTDTGSGNGNGNGGGTTAATYGAPINLGNIYPHAINKTGQIVAVENTSNSGRAFFLSSPTAAPQYLAANKGVNPYVLYLDDAGEILGWNVDSGYAYYLTPTSAPVNLSGGELTLNSKGAVVGYINYAGFYQASLAGTRVSLPTLKGAEGSIANWVNATGQIVGQTYGPTTGNKTVPIYWADPTGSTLATALAVPAGGNITSFGMINDKGQIIGTTDILINGVINFAPIYWKSPTDTSPQILPDLPNAFQPSTVTAINNSGLIIGSSNNHAALWKDGKVTDLNTAIPANSGWLLQSATAINDQGWIVGTGTLTDSTGPHASAFLIKPQ